ncbi:MAG: hypothetical protein QME70_04105 [Bacillota bacterium]|nr:hypothetical protein [Bacillota bacterium]
MDSERLVEALQRRIPERLARDLMDNFTTMAQDVATGTLGRSAPGKFVETLVQVLQYLESGTFESQPKVDKYLQGLESRSTPLDEGLRLCAARIGRAMYTLRNKRGIVHKGAVDPNRYDLRFLYAAAQWILSELVRVASGLPLEEAHGLVEQVNIPVRDLIQDMATHRIVLEDLPADKEVLVLMHSWYPNVARTGNILASLSRRGPRTVSRVLKRLWERKLIERLARGEWALTQKGFSAAASVIRGCLSREE